MYKIPCGYTCKYLKLNKSDSPLHQFRPSGRSERACARNALTHEMHLCSHKFAPPVRAKLVQWSIALKRISAAGTTTYSKFKDYCDEVGLKKYDTFLIMASKRFTVYSRLLAEKVKSLGKSFFFVRTKIDDSYHAESRKDKFDEKKMLDKIMTDCLKNLKDLKVKDKEVFLISNFDLDKWDFLRLINAINDVLPLRQKESLMLSLTTFCKEIVAEKAEILRGKHSS